MNGGGGATSPPPPDDDESLHTGLCIICFEAFDENKHRPGLGPCGHEGTCGMCYIRLRKIMNEKTCCYCKATLDQVYIFPSLQDVVPYRSLNIWGDNAGPNMVFDEATRIFMPKDFYQDVYLALQQPRCRESGCTAKPSRNLQALKDHLRERHERYLCDVCVENKKVFLGEQIRYTKEALSRHQKEGNPEVGFKGHPLCEFCQKRYYDGNHLYEHLTKQHFSCDICEREGIRHKYYKNYPDLEHHFRQSHFLCEDPGCLEKKFVVFTNPIDFQAHMVSVHPEQGASRRVQVKFRVRGARRGGGAPADDDEDDTTNDIYNTPAPQPDSFSFDPTNFPELSDESSRAFRTRARGGGGGGGGDGGRGGGRFGNTRFSGADFPALGGGSGGRGAAPGGGSAGFRNAVMPYPTAGMVARADTDKWSYPEVQLDEKVVASGKGKKKNQKKGGGGGGSSLEAKAQPEVEQKMPASSVGTDRKALEEMILGWIGEEAFVDLRSISRQLRQGSISGPEYYDAVMILIPLREDRQKVMKALLQLLPDETLQRDIQQLVEERDKEVVVASVSRSTSSGSTSSASSSRTPTSAVRTYGSALGGQAPPRASVLANVDDNPPLQASAPPKRKAAPPKKKPQGKQGGNWANALASIGGTQQKKKSTVTIVTFKKPTASAPAPAPSLAPRRLVYEDMGEVAEAPTVIGSNIQVSRAAPPPPPPPGLRSQGPPPRFSSSADFPSLPTPPPGLDGFVVRRKGDDDDDDDNGQQGGGAGGGGGGGGKKKNKNKKKEEAKALQNMVFNFK